MPRKRRRQPIPLEIAEALTSFWVLLFGITIVVPRAFGGTPPSLSNDTFLMLVGGAALVLASWGWVIAFFRRQTATGKRLEELQAMTPSGFEEWVGARFRERGYAVQVTGTHGTGGDHGIDLLVKRDGETAVVQAKKHITRPVGEPVLRDLFGAMTAAGADRAYLVTTGRVTDQARQWVSGKPIEVWDADYVVHLSLGAAAAPIEEVRLAVASSATVPLCPRCGAKLVERRNSKTGDSFLGCSTFPRCRQTMPASRLT